MNILFCGDIVGRSGREIIKKEIPRIKLLMDFDCIIVNGENSAQGFGITSSICKEFYELGINIITSGNHIWDQREIIEYLDKDPYLLRPANYPTSVPGHGFCFYRTNKGKNILVINIIGQLFMGPFEDPFRVVDNILTKYPLNKSSNAIIIDFHGEASSEKMAMGHFCDGRASLVIGTHSHIPTADSQILINGTAYQTDAGMCGDYNSIIGMNKDIAIKRIIKKIPVERLKPAEGLGTLCGVIVKVNDNTGLADEIFPVRLGSILTQSFPKQYA